MMIKARSVSSSSAEAMFLFISENRAKCSINLFNQKKSRKKKKTKQQNSQYAFSELNWLLTNQDSWWRKRSRELYPGREHFPACWIEHRDWAEHLGSYVLCQKMSPYTNTSDHGQPSCSVLACRWTNIKTTIMWCHFSWERATPCWQCTAQFQEKKDLFFFFFVRKQALQWSYLLADQRGILVKMHYFNIGFISLWDNFSNQSIYHVMITGSKYTIYCSYPSFFWMLLDYIWHTHFL